MPPLKDNSEDYKIERPHRHIIHEAHQFEYTDFSRNCALLRCNISKIKENVSTAQIRANEVYEADAEVINIKAQLDYTTQRHKNEKEEMLASFHRALEVEAKQIIKLKDKYKEDMENETKKMFKLKDQHEDECNKNKMRVHDLFYSIKCTTGDEKEVADLRGNRGFTEESCIQLIQKEFSDAGAKIKDLKIQLHSTEKNLNSAEKKHSVEKQELKTQQTNAEKQYSVEKQELKLQQNKAEKKHLLEKQELKTQQTNAEKKHLIEKKQELKTQQNNAEKKHIIEQQELKMQQNNAEKKHIQELKTQQNNAEKKHLQELKTQQNNAEEINETKIEELKDAFEKEKNAITNRCNAERKEKNEIIESYNAEKKEKNDLFISYTEIKALHIKNRDRKKIVSFQKGRFFGS